MARNIVFNDELSDILTELWNADTNRCISGVDYKLNLQGYVTATKGPNLRDRAKDKLFSYFNEDVIFKKPTYESFLALLNNYEDDVESAETETELEVEEVERFLSAILKTKVMKVAHEYLKNKNMVSGKETDFKKLLHDIWFKLYKRNRDDSHLNSCGFEHVFVGEKRLSEVIGFHNWIQIYLEEKSGNLDYRGYFRRGTTEESEIHPRLLTLQFEWKHSLKPIGSSFVGTSPEFEIAMYSIALLCGRPSFNDNNSNAARMGGTNRNGLNVRIDKYSVELIVHKLGALGIGSAYPISLAE